MAMVAEKCETPRTRQPKRLLLIGGGQFFIDTIQQARGYFEVSGITNARHQASLINFDGDIKVQRQVLDDLEVAIFETEQFVIPQIWSSDEYFVATLSVSSDWIFNEKHINALGPEFFNLHNSDLPNFRGGGGLTWQILGRVEESGATIHRVDSGIDTGQKIMSRRYTLFKDADLKKLFAQQRTEVNALLSDFITSLYSEVDFIEEQIFDISVSELGSYWPRLSTQANAWIDWSWDVESILDFIRAFGPPFVGAATHFKGKEVRIHQARLHDASSYYHPFQRGIIFAELGGEFLVATKGGSVRIPSLFEAGVELTPSASWLGERLFTPHECLTSAYTTRFRLN